MRLHWRELRAIRGAEASKLRAELGWSPMHTDFASGLRNVIDWYAEHRDWWAPAKEATEARYRAQGQ